MAAAGKLGIISKVGNTQNTRILKLHTLCASVKGGLAAKERCIFRHCPNSNSTFPFHLLETLWH